MPAHLGAGLSRGRKVELPHTQGIGQAWGWVGTCSCDGPYSCIIHYFCNKICSKIPRCTIKLNPCTAVCRPALAPAFPRGGKWSFRTLRGLARRWDWKMRARVSVNIMHNNLIHVDLWNSCHAVRLPFRCSDLSIPRKQNHYNSLLMHWLSASLDHRWPIYSGRKNLCLARVNVLSAQCLVSEIIEKSYSMIP